MNKLARDLVTMCKNIFTWVFRVRIPDSLCGTLSGETQMLGSTSWTLQTATTWQSLVHITARCFLIQLLVDWIEAEMTGQTFSGSWQWGRGTNSVNPSQMSVVTKCFCEFCKNVNHRLNKWMSTECFISLLFEITWSLDF